MYGTYTLAGLYRWQCMGGGANLENSRRGIAVRGPMIKAKAQELSPECEASEGWLARFKWHQALKFRKFVGEKQSADNCAADEWIEKRLPDIMKD